MKQLQSDIVVISAGTAGLAAAVTAAEARASVIVFEKMRLTGGTGNMANGLFAVESRIQREKLVSLTKEEAFQIYMDFTQWRVNARLVKNLIDKSADTIDWLEKMGIEFFELGCHNIGFYYTWHLIKGPVGQSKRHVGAGAAVMDALAKRSKELGVQIFLETPVKQILKKGDRVVGVIAEDKYGESIQVNAGAVISATGGNSIGSVPGRPGLVGGGIRMAREIGAETTEPVTAAAQKRRQPKRDMASMIVRTTFRQPNLIVNLLGERFMNEEIINTSPFSDNILIMQKDGTVFTIFDEDTKNQYVEKGLDFSMSAPAAFTYVPNFDADFKAVLDGGANNLFKADSIEEIALKTGIDQNALQQTISEYNKACDTGRDEIFDKKAKYLRPVRKPKFYVYKHEYFDSQSWEGIRVNYKTEVLTKDFKVIPGFYAAGIDIACNYYSGTYPWILPATAMGFAINSGRIAGENAAEYVKHYGL